MVVFNREVELMDENCARKVEPQGRMNDHGRPDFPKILVAAELVKTL